RSIKNASHEKIEKLLYPFIHSNLRQALHLRDWNFEDMREDISYGIYAKGMRGGQVDTVRGEFQFSAEEAFLIEKGALTKRLKNVSLSGRTLDVLKNIDVVGNDKKRGSIGFCGKDGQEVPVSEYAPHVRVKKILVGGLQ
ncbi:MAG: hypothetical protein KAT65_21645, partial [Methanophagales archaeon]|nr:hypothetical protein [Methanophagales archaeon]